MPTLLIANIVDESEVAGQQFVNILFRSLQVPAITCLCDWKPLQSSPTCEVISRLIDDTLRDLSIFKSEFALLISDAARYKVKSRHPAADNVIAAVIVKNRDWRQLFDIIGQPPCPIMTTWVSWLNAAFWYAKHFPAVREIVLACEGDGWILIHAKEAVSVPTLNCNILSVLQYKQTFKWPVCCATKSLRTPCDKHIVIYNCCHSTQMFPGSKRTSRRGLKQMTLWTSCVWRARISLLPHTTGCSVREHPVLLWRYVF